MDPRRAPARVRLRHRTNHRKDVGGHRRSPDPTSTLPGPPEPETVAVPGDDGLGFHDHERRSPSGPDARQQDPEPAVRLREPDSRRSGALQHVQLVPQGQDFKVERRARTRQGSEGQQERVQHGDHGREAYPPPPATSTAATRTEFSVRKTSSRWPRSAKVSAQTTTISNSSMRWIVAGVGAKFNSDAFWRWTAVLLQGSDVMVAVVPAARAPAS
jgi:hypothetical protein